MIWREQLGTCYWDAAAVVVAALGTGYGVYSGQQGQAAQKTGLRRQAQAQQQAQDAAQRQMKLSAEAEARKNRKQPDIASILATEAELGRAGPASTLLTGPQGVRRPPARPTTLLGE